MFKGFIGLFHQLFRAEKCVAEMLEEETLARYIGFDHPLHKQQAFVSQNILAAQSHVS
jgi:hypothetical protein